MTPDTRQVILDKSEVLVRSRGYSAFSYADLAKDMGIAKASVHYHFATKEDLVNAILRRCIERGADFMARTRSEHVDARDCLRAYAQSYVASVESGMLPACGALAASRSSLPPSTYPALNEFFQNQFDWIAGVVRDGIAQGVLAPPQPPEQAAVVLFSAIEGGTMIGWGMNDSTRVLAAFEAILECMQGPAAVGKQPQAQGNPAGFVHGAQPRLEDRSP
jgi:TetR/AcrR family transcriptional repressor of nem operon